ncbi:MAG: hypothetical protein PGMFKBFP_03016 [Anaerolineales bacterium]|nr:hypothetical protein [Anaerolineales bacterium]
MEVGVHAHAGVADDDLHAATGQVNLVGRDERPGDADPSLVGGELDGVGDQVREDFAEDVRVGFNHREGGQVESQGEAAVGERFLEAEANVPRQRGRVHRLDVELQGARVDLGDVEHRIHDLVQAQGAFVQRSDRLPDVLVEAAVFEQHFDVAAHDGERRAEFVRGDGDEVAFGLVETLKVAVDLVEVAVGLAQLVVEFEQVFHETGVFERDGGLVGERGHGDKLLVAVALTRKFRAEGQHPDPAAVGEDRRVDLGLEAVEPFALEAGDVFEFLQQVEVELKKRLRLPPQMDRDGVVLLQLERQDLPLAVGPRGAQPMDAASACGGFGVHQKEEAAFEFHRLDDESHRHVGETLHVEDVADGLAVLMEGAAGVGGLDVQKTVHHAAHESEQGGEQQSQQQGDGRADDERIVIGRGAEQGLDAERAGDVEDHDQQRGDNVDQRAAEDETRVGQVVS